MRFKTFQEYYSDRDQNQNSGAPVVGALGNLAYHLIGSPTSHTSNRYFANSGNQGGFYGFKSYDAPGAKSKGYDPYLRQRRIDPRKINWGEKSTSPKQNYYKNFPDNAIRPSSSGKVWIISTLLPWQDSHQDATSVQTALTEFHRNLGEVPHIANHMRSNPMDLNRARVGDYFPVSVGGKDFLKVIWRVPRKIVQPGPGNSPI